MAIAVALGFAIASGVAYLAAAATHPAADTRHWETIPGAFYLATGTVPADTYSVDIECQLPAGRDFILNTHPLGVVGVKKQMSKDGSWIKPDNLLTYGTATTSVEVKPCSETMVLLNAGPFLDSADAFPPITGQVPLAPRPGD